MKTMNTRKPIVNHKNRTIAITNTFMHAAADPTSSEFEMYMKLTTTCPNYKVVIVKAHNKANDNNKKPRITYDKMGKYIACLRGAESLMPVFEKVKRFAKSQPNAYALVSHWFFESFPDYGCQPDFDSDGFPIVENNCISFEVYKQQNEVTQQQNQSTVEQLEA